VRRARESDGLPTESDNRKQMLYIWSHWLRWVTPCPERRRTLAHLLVSDDITSESQQTAHHAFVGIRKLQERSREDGSMRDASREFVVVPMSALADATIDFMIHDPVNADNHCVVAFEALWRMVAECVFHFVRFKGATPMSILALVTGASSGIGKAFAERLAADGYDLIVVGRRRERLEALAASLPEVAVQVVAADLSTDDGIDTVAALCASQPLTMLVNNAGVAHYMPMAALPAEKARELVHVKVVAPTMLTRATLPGMIARGGGTIVNVAGMIAFSGPAPASQMPRRALYAGTLAHTVALSQTLHAELEGTGVNVHVVCPGVVATEFHAVQGMDLSAVPRMSAEDVVAAALAGIKLGEVVSAPGVEDYRLLEAVFGADLAAFAAQSPQLASRYRAH